MYRVTNLTYSEIIVKNPDAYIPPRGSPLGFWWIDVEFMTAELSRFESRRIVQITEMTPSGGFPSNVNTLPSIAVLNPGEVVYWNEGSGTLEKAIANDDVKMKVYGIVQSYAAGLAEVVTDGLLAGLSGLIPQGIYFLSDSVAGQITTTPPTASGSWVLEIGIAKSAMELNVNIHHHSAVKNL